MRAEQYLEKFAHLWSKRHWQLCELLCTVMLCTVLCKKNFSTHFKIPGDLLDLIRKSKCISSILPIVMQSENKESDVLCSGSCICNRFGRREVATESLVCIICRKRRFQLDSLTPAEVCGAGSWEKNPQGKKKAFKKVPFCCQLSTTMPESLQRS